MTAGAERFCELHVRLVHEHGRHQRLSHVKTCELTARERPQVVIDQSEQRVPGARIAVTPGGKQRGDVTAGVIGWMHDDRLFQQSESIRQPVDIASHGRTSWNWESLALVRTHLTVKLNLFPVEAIFHCREMYSSNRRRRWGDSTGQSLRLDGEATFLSSLRDSVFQRARAAVIEVAVPSAFFYRGFSRSSG